MEYCRRMQAVLTETDAGMARQVALQRAHPGGVKMQGALEKADDATAALTAARLSVAAMSMRENCPAPLDLPMSSTTNA